MSAEGDMERRSTRLTKGMPPVRFPATEPQRGGRNSDHDYKSVRSKSKTVKSTSSSRRQEIELDAERELLGLEKTVVEKETTLKLAENAVNSIKKKLELFTTGDSAYTDEHDKKRRDLLQSLIEAEDRADALKIELESLNRIVEKEKRIINLSKDMELSKVESDDDVTSIDSTEEKEKQKRLQSWVKEQAENMQATPLTRITADASKLRVTKTPNCDGPANQVTRPVTDAPPRKPVLPRTMNKPAQVYAHQLRQETATESYEGASENGLDLENAETSPQHNSDQVTMRDLVNALNQFGAGRSQGQVVMKTTVDKDLPKFGGEPAEWIQFRSEFERTTEKYKFDNSENMIRLRKSLVGAARSTVQHLMVNVQNVDIILDSLEKRFGRPRVVLNALASKAKSCANVTTAKPESIIEFGLAVQALVTNIISYKEDGYLNSVELMETLVKKLSHDLATKWFEWLAADQNREENLLGFSEWSSMQLEIAYQRVDFKSEEITAEKDEKRRRRGPGSIHISTGDDENCACCGKKGHTLEKCWAFQKKTIDDRWKIIKRDKICICCLKPGHRAKQCELNRRCEINGCDKVHHRLLHYEKKNKEETVAKREEEPHQEGNVQLVGNIAIIAGCDGPLPIVPVKVSGPNGTLKTYALLDCGASRSLVKKELAEKLGLEGETFEYKYNGITGGAIEKESQRVSLDIAGVYRGSKYKKLRAAVTVQDIQMNPYSIDMNKIKEKWPYLKSIAASSLTNAVPQLIVGNNNPHLILARKIVQRDDEEPVGWRTELGWAVSGNFDNDAIGNINTLTGKEPITNEDLHHLMKRSFSLDELGVRISKCKGDNLEEKRAYQILEQTTKKVGNQWETGLLWRADDVVFPESETSALRRLEYTERKMKDPEYKKMYMDKIEEYVAKGYIKRLSPHEARIQGSRTYVIPHFGVTNPNKPGKFRFILDAKAKTHGVSLNDMLLKGPDLTRSLVGVFWNFRRHLIGLTGDISDMFHRIRIREEDTDSQRFLWRNGNSANAAEHFLMLVMFFGATPSPSSATYVKNRNAEDFRDEYPQAVEEIIASFYVDDCLTGGNTVEEVVELRRQISMINASGNFTVCKWLCNSKEVLASIPNELRADGGKSLRDKEDLPGERVLGMWWNPSEDEFQFKLGLHKVKTEILNGGHPTKRQMCGLIMSLFDPMGFIAHFKIKGLILLQEVWRTGVDWDDKIPSTTFTKWVKWTEQLKELVSVRVPRCYSAMLVSAEDVQLHTFVDSSAEAFSCICYLRIQQNKDIEVAFVAAKARVAPLKKSTIPKLELQAALLGSRLAGTIQKELKLEIKKRFFWSDSSTVLQWLRSRSSKLKEFVANRIGEIQETTNVDEWHWIPTKKNIADVATRFDGVISFDPNCEWYQGPAFLLSDCSTWKFEEDRKREKADGLVATFANMEKNDRIGETSTGTDLTAVIPNPDRFSSYWRLVRSTAAVRKSAIYWICKVRKEKTVPPWKKISNEKQQWKYQSSLTADDLAAAEVQLFKLAQANEYGNEMEEIRKGKVRKGKLWRLSPIMDKDGIIRVDGRIGAMKDIPEDVKFPIILPPRHRITELIVDLQHKSNAHQGLETILGNLRQRFWIVDGRNAVRKSWQRCQLCRIRKCKPVTPVMGQLPLARLASRQPPFTYAGIDLFGPLEVVVGRHHEKRWGVLVCCMVTRAVYLEVVHALSTDEIILALSRFIDTRGRPAVIHSDNGTNFVGAAKELRHQWSLVDFQQVQECGRFQQIRWSFNPPGAPHMGGVWERLIQTVKRCLLTTLNEKYPKDTTLLTVFKAVENMMNSRPITHVSSDPTDPDPITPNHILRGGCDAGPAIPSVLDDSDEFLRKQWKRGQVLADQFWIRWTRDYLPKLIRREKWHESFPQIEEGTLVFIVDEQLPRNCWSRGYISKVFPGNDGHVRVVEVVTKDPVTKRMKTTRRPVAKVCSLGLKMEIKEPNGP